MQHVISRCGDHAFAARWRTQAASERAVAARLPHGGEPNIEWQVRRHGDAKRKKKRARASTARRAGGVAFARRKSREWLLAGDAPFVSPSPPRV